ncbi:MAG: polysaccharide deacetylase family protein [Acidobacteria bacterium]|nr:polysaccharide deacetylase family protein [Acidobacteriota bacterium]
MTRPLMSLSLDLDNLWSYMKTHGDEGWHGFPTYLDTLSGLVVDRLTRLGLPLTIFVVGQDAALEKNHAALRRLADAGFEIGNHSFHHEPWLHLYTREQLEEEIGAAERAIEAATGRRPAGFRGPGFSLSNDTLAVLLRHGYAYDCSTFPTFLGPLARAYYFWQSRGFSDEEREKRSRLFGTLRDGLRPLRPYWWPLPEGRLLEIPVTTMPGLRAPFHLSYLLYLASLSPAVARGYLRTAVALCRARRVQPSFLLHPLDLLGGDVVTELAFFPGMGLSTDFKLRWFDDTLGYLARHFTIVTLRDHARAAQDAAPLARALPDAA